MNNAKTAEESAREWHEFLRHSGVFLIENAERIVTAVDYHSGWVDVVIRLRLGEVPEIEVKQGFIPGSWIDSISE